MLRVCRIVNSYTVLRKDNVNGVLDDNTVLQKDNVKGVLDELRKYREISFPSNHGLNIKTLLKVSSFFMFHKLRIPVNYELVLGFQVTQLDTSNVLHC